MTRPTLYATYYSPWSQRARWALEHHQIQFRYREHIPMLGELALRMRAGRWRDRKASVPLLLPGDGEPIMDSLAIMRWADAHGHGESLDSESPQAAQWRDRLEPWMHALRMRVTRRLARDPEALHEAAAGGVGPWLAGPSRPVAALGARHVARKYGFDVHSDRQEREVIQAGLDALREAIGDGPYVGERFGAVDLMAACFLQGVEPADDYVRLGPATRRLWADEELSSANADLVEWRNELCRRHRRPTRGAGPTASRSGADHELAER